MLWFWVIVLVALIGAIAVVAAGRGDSMVEPYDDRPDVRLPPGRPLTADDLHAVRLNTGVRGYRMDEVDALLARIEAEMLDREDLDAVAVSGGRPGVSADAGADTAVAPPTAAVLAPSLADETQTLDGAEPVQPVIPGTEPEPPDEARDA